MHIMVKKQKQTKKQNISRQNIKSPAPGTELVQNRNNASMYPLVTTTTSSLSLRCKLKYGLYTSVYHHKFFWNLWTKLLK